jgi:hypothetical protein
MRIIAVAVQCAIGFLIVSCQHKEPEPLVPAAGTMRAIDEAVGEVSTARCDHEQRCNHIGAEMRYSDRDHCLSVKRAEARRDIEQCRAGIDQDDLRECLTQIANEGCNGTVTRLEEYKECNLDDLCTR